MHIDATKEVVLSFPTPIWIVNLAGMDNLNRRLEQPLLAMELETRKSAANFSEMYPNGYTTFYDHPDLFAIPPFDELAQKIFIAVASYAGERGYDMSKRRLAMHSMFGNVQFENSLHAMHHHPNSTFSGVYYVSAPEGSSKLRFRDPSILARMAEPTIDQCNATSAEVIDFDPIEGRLVIFPSYLEHEVLLNRSKKPRIAISFNIVIERIQPKTAI